MLNTITKSEKWSENILAEDEIFLSIAVHFKNIFFFRSCKFIADVNNIHKKTVYRTTRTFAIVLYASVVTSLTPEDEYFTELAQLIVFLN